MPKSSTSNHATIEAYRELFTCALSRRELNESRGVSLTLLLELYPEKINADKIYQKLMQDFLAMMLYPIPHAHRRMLDNLFYGYQLSNVPFSESPAGKPLSALSVKWGLFSSNLPYPMEEMIALLNQKDHEQSSKFFFSAASSAEKLLKIVVAYAFAFLDSGNATFAVENTLSRKSVIIGGAVSISDDYKSLTKAEIYHTELEDFALNFVYQTLTWSESLGLGKTDRIRTTVRQNMRTFRF